MQRHTAANHSCRLQFSKDADWSGYTQVTKFPSHLLLRNKFQKRFKSGTFPTEATLKEGAFTAVTLKSIKNTFCSLERRLAINENRVLNRLFHNVGWSNRKSTAGGSDFQYECHKTEAAVYFWRNTNTRADSLLDRTPQQRLVLSQR